MTKNRVVSLCILSSCLMVAALQNTAMAKGKDQKKSHDQTPPPFGYVLLAQQAEKTVALARIVLPETGAKCDKMTLEGPQGKKTMGDLTTRKNYDEKSYPITVCEAVIPWSDSYQPKGEEWVLHQDKNKSPIQLATATTRPQRAMVIGDTGCRGDKAQVCEDNTWPFKQTIPSQVAQQILADGQSTVLVHVGDYKYLGKAEKDYKEKGESWKNWTADFFQPMLGSGLFAMAPMVVTRGNHELCYSMGDNGPGWFLLLDPAPDTAAHCVEDGKEEPLSPTYRLDFDNNLTMVVIDTSNVAEGKLDPDEAKMWGETLQATGNAIKASGREAWLIGHKPIWSALANCKVPANPSISNLTLQNAVASLDNKSLDAFKLVLSGHKHLYQSVEAKDPSQPLQLVVGNSGVVLNSKAFNGTTTDTMNANIHSMSAFGFSNIQVQSANPTDNLIGWTIHVNGISATTPNTWSDPTLVETCVYATGGGTTCTVVSPSSFEGPCNQSDAERE